MPLAATASRTDRERAIASVEMLISKHEATAPRTNWQAS
jgi:hypothetical protein